MSGNRRDARLRPGAPVGGARRCALAAVARLSIGREWWKMRAPALQRARLPATREAPDDHTP